MTTFQDPPLQSRRAVRQNERDQSPAAVVPDRPCPLRRLRRARRAQRATDLRHARRRPGPRVRRPELPRPPHARTRDRRPARDRSAAEQDAGSFRPA